jgi:hypothetical protein
MPIKNIFLTATLIILSSVAVFSQAEIQSKKLYKNEIGIDVANILTFLERNTQSYLINYKRHFQNNTALRLGFNFDISSDNDKGNYFDGKLGYEAYLIKNKWQVIGGFDGSYSYDKANYQSNYINVIGFSPLIGVKYHLSKHFSIATECKLNFLYNMYSDPESFDPEANREEWDINIGAVGMLIVSYHFNLKK